MTPKEVEDVVGRLESIQVSGVRANYAVLGSRPIEAANEVVRQAVSLLRTQSERIAELEAAIDAEEKPHGMPWRFWSDKARQTAEKVDALMQERTSLIETKREQIDALTAQLSTAQSTVERYREALEPFAETAEGIDDICHPDWEMWEHPAAMNVYVRDFRRARSVLEGK